MDTKKRIQNTAQKLYQENGFSTVTINDICSACHITKPTFYKYFKNKEDTIAHIYDDVTTNIIENVHELILADNYAEQLWLCFSSLIKQSVEIGHDIISQMFRINLEHDLGSFDFIEKFSAVCIAITQKGQEAGQFRNPAPAKDLYQALCYAFTGYQVMWCIKDGQFDFVEEIRKAIQIVYITD